MASLKKIWVFFPLLSSLANFQFYSTVSSGKTLKENNLVESEVLFKISSKLVVNKIAFKLNNDKVSQIIKQIKKAISG